MRDGLFIEGVRDLPGREGGPGFFGCLDLRGEPGLFGCLDLGGGPGLFGFRDLLDEPGLFLFLFAIPSRLPGDFRPG